MGGGESCGDVALNSCSGKKWKRGGMQKKKAEKRRSDSLDLTPGRSNHFKVFRVDFGIEALSWVDVLTISVARFISKKKKKHKQKKPGNPSCLLLPTCFKMFRACAFSPSHSLPMIHFDLKKK